MELVNFSILVHDLQDAFHVVQVRLVVVLIDLNQFDLFVEQPSEVPLVDTMVWVWRGSGVLCEIYDRFDSNYEQFDEHTFAATVVLENGLYSLSAC